MNNPMRQSVTLNTDNNHRHDAMRDEVFKGFQRITLEQTGIELADSKRSMIINRFSKRLDALGLSCFEEYLNLVSQPRHPETREFIDTVTTNLTYFFREPHHFQVLSKMVLPKLAQRINKQTPIRIWSAGCSSGAEPYSLAIVAKETDATHKRPVKILCTDIDSKMVGLTKQGNYSEDQMRGLDAKRKERWFARSTINCYAADEKLRSMLVCKQLNLFDHWPIKPGVDVIMCRNVLIYFNPQYQRRLLASFVEIQRPGSYLFLGHSETLEDFKGAYKRVDNTVYERI